MRNGPEASIINPERSEITGPTASGDSTHLWRHQRKHPPRRMTDRSTPCTVYHAGGCSHLWRHKSLRFRTARNDSRLAVKEKLWAVTSGTVEVDLHGIMHFYILHLCLFALIGKLINELYTYWIQMTLHLFLYFLLLLLECNWRVIGYEWNCMNVT